MVFNVLVGNLRMCSIPTGKHVRAQGLFSVRVATPSAGYRLECCRLRLISPDFNLRNLFTLNWEALGSGLTSFGGLQPASVLGGQGIMSLW